jgi:hypothetical protein
MLGMNSKEIRHKIVYIFLGIYLVYGIVYIGMTGVLFSAAVGLIAMSFHCPPELMVAGIIISGLMWDQFFRRRKDGFTGHEVPLAGGKEQQGIINRVGKFKWNAGPQAVLSSSFAEGFSDASAQSEDSSKGVDVPPPANSATSTPASTNAPASTEQLKEAVPNPKKAASTTAGFTDKLTDGMFKLGSVPADTVGGSHIDIGTTLMNALNSMKPDQIKSMTEDTRKLMETQKDLMGMLSSVKPMLQDGKQLMSTFNDMFGSMPKLN